MALLDDLIADASAADIKAAELQVRIDALDGTESEKQRVCMLQQLDELLRYKAYTKALEDVVQNG